MTDAPKESRLSRYNKGANSVLPKPTDYWHTMGHESAQGAAEDSGNTSGPGAVDFLVAQSEGKSWTAWTGLIFAVLAMGYCFLYVDSILASLAIVTAAGICGALLPGLFFMAIGMCLVGLIAIGIFALVF
ncbi:MAG: hypothetical protein AAF662_02900 [Pseudomonadota bacterium]